MKNLHHDYFFEEIILRLNQCLPRGLQIFKVTEPLMKAGKIAFANFTIKISDDKTSSAVICKQLSELFALDTIEIEKKSKKGLKTVDIKPSIKNFRIEEKFDFAELNITLTAGSTDNVNPNLILAALEKYFSVCYDFDITRNELFNSNMEVFR